MCPMKLGDVKFLTFDVFGTLLKYEPGCVWIQEYVAEVAKIQTGVKPYRPLSEIFQEIDADWKSLKVRPGVLRASLELKKDYAIVSLSNADWSLAERIERYFGFVWDHIIDTESVYAFKPDPRVYQLALHRLDCKPDEVCHVAAHPYDLDAAKKAGFHTAYIHWKGYAEPVADDRFDCQVDSLTDLAAILNKGSDEQTRT